MFARASLLLAVLLSACAGDVRTLQLSDVDLADMKLVRKLGRSLSTQERTALITYAAVHAPNALMFCGQELLTHSGEEPETIGDAIELTLAREAQVRWAESEAAKPKTAGQLVAEKWDDVIVQRELIIARQAVLLSEHGSVAETLPEWFDLKAKMARYDKALTALRREIEGSS